METERLRKTLDAILLTAESPLPVDKLVLYFDPNDAVNHNDVKNALTALQQASTERGFELLESASGFRYQSREEYKEHVSRHWEEKPQKYSRAMLETLALIVYRQPITRAEIEEIRGVSVSSNIVKALMEREWVRIVGHKEVPGRPAMLGTTRQFLDYFGLKNLDEMPPLAEIQDLDKMYPELNFETGDANAAVPDQQQTAENQPDNENANH